MNYADLSDDDRTALWRGIGCTYEGCATGDEPWLAIEGNSGTEAEGKLAVLCESHMKMMAAPETDADDFIAHVIYLDVGGAPLGRTGGVKEWLLWLVGWLLYPAIVLVGAWRTSPSYREAQAAIRAWLHARPNRELRRAAHRATATPPEGW